MPVGQMGARCKYVNSTCPDRNCLRSSARVLHLHDKFGTSEISPPLATISAPAHLIVRVSEPGTCAAPVSTITW